MSSEKTLRVPLAGKKLLGLDAWSTGPRTSVDGECGKRLSEHVSEHEDKRPGQADEMGENAEVDVLNARATRGEGSSRSSRGVDRAGSACRSADGAGRGGTGRTERGGRGSDSASRHGTCAGIVGGKSAGIAGGKRRRTVDSDVLHEDRVCSLPAPASSSGSSKELEELEEEVRVLRQQVAQMKGKGKRRGKGH